MDTIILKKVLRDYTYLTESLEDVKSISSMAESGFRTALQQKDEKAIQALVTPNSKSPEKIEEELQETQVDNHNDKKFKKLFRKVAVKCHPDKLDASLPENIKNLLKSKYEDLILANEEYDWGMLIKLALEFEIEIDEIDEEQISNIEKKIEVLKTEISKYESSMAYNWYQMKDETLKDKYLAQCAMIFKKHLGI